MDLLERARRQNILITTLVTPGLGVIALVALIFLVPALVAYGPAARDAAALERSTPCSTHPSVDCRSNTEAIVTAYEPTNGIAPTEVTFQVSSGSAPVRLHASFQKGEPAFTTVGESDRIEVWRGKVISMMSANGETALSYDNPQFNERQLIGGVAISTAIFVLIGLNALVWMVIGLRTHRDGIRQDSGASGN